MVLPVLVVAAAGSAGTAAAGTAVAGGAVAGGAGVGAAGAAAGGSQALSAGRIASTMKTMKQGKAVAQMVNVSFPGKGGVEDTLRVEALSPGGAKMKAFKAAKERGLTDGNLSDFGHKSNVTVGTPEAAPEKDVPTPSRSDWLPDPMRILE